MALLEHIFTTFFNTIRAVLPIVVIIFGFQFLIIRKPILNVKQVINGFIYVLIGLSIFLVGLEEALFPIGKLMAVQLTDPEFIQKDIAAGTLHWYDYRWVYLFGAAIGFASVIAEPALLAVAIKAHQVSGGAISIAGLRIAVGIGVAIGVALGTFRIVTGTPLHYYIMSAYVVVIIQTMYAPKILIALAYDSGGVTTSTVTVPLIAALGLGLASTVPGRSTLLDGFGLIAFACLFPIMTVMAYAQIVELRHTRESD